MTDLIKQIEELNLRCDSSTLLPVILQVEQLIKERDEARRDLQLFNDPRRWQDCFKEKEETQ